MSSLSLLNSSGVMPFLTLTAVFLFIGPVLIIGIATMWSNLKQKISDELSARVTRIVNDLDTKNNTPEIENIFSKLTAEINTKITNELSARLSEVNSSFTAELGKNSNKLTAEIKKINSRDAGYASEAQKILLMVNNVTTRLDNIEEACRNDFASVNAFIDALQNGLIDLIQYYAIARRNQPVETDQQSVSNHSEASSGSSSSSGPITFKGISLTIWTQFKEIFGELGGNIKKVTVQGFYERNIKKKDGYISTLDDIGLWLDSKLSVNNNASSGNNNAE